MPGNVLDRMAAEVRTRRFALACIFLVGVALVLLTHYLRAHVAAQGWLAKAALDSLPNFIAAVTMPAWWLVLLGRAPIASRAPAWLLGLASMALSQALLIGWEFEQVRRVEMTFDSNDIVATLIGGAVWTLAWPWLNRSLPAN